MPGSGRRMARRRFVATAAVAGLALISLRGVAYQRSAQAAPAEDGAFVIRVLLRRGDGNLEAPSVAVSSDTRFTVWDLAAGTGVADGATGEPARIDRDRAGLWVSLADGRRRGPFVGPLQVSAEAAEGRLHHLLGAARPAAYRGAFELAGGPGGGVVLVNALPIEEYLLGVVPREIPPSWGGEPARVQAVAARTYALVRRSNSPHRQVGADVCDGTDCQAYGGVAAEHAVGTAAVETTRNLVVLRDGSPVATSYSSACGGHTEAPRVGAAAGPSVRGARAEGRPDGEVPSWIDLGSDAGAAEFYRAIWDSHCVSAPRYRWKIDWDRRQLEDGLAAGLRRLSGSPSVSPRFPSGGAMGALRGLTVTERGSSGRVRNLYVEGSNGGWLVQGDWPIRDVLRTPGGETLASTAFALELAFGRDGRLGTISVSGGGWGHGVGMCQWGARGLAEKGLSAEAILAHYYPETYLGSIGAEREGIEPRPRPALPAPRIIGSASERSAKVARPS